MERIIEALERATVWDALGFMGFAALVLVGVVL